MAGQDINTCFALSECHKRAIRESKMAVDQDVENSSVGIGFAKDMSEAWKTWSFQLKPRVISADYYISRYMCISMCWNKYF